MEELLNWAACRDFTCRTEFQENGVQEKDNEVERD